MRIFLVFAILLAPNLISFSDEPKSEGWTLTFSDDFDGDSLDYEKWNPFPVWDVELNNELQAYVRNQFFVKDGILSVRAERRKQLYDGKVRDYCSGKMTTTGRFAQKFGRFEIRCKMPKGKGLWPTFWLLPEPPGWPPEIDVVEFLGHEVDKVYLTNHWPRPGDPDESDSITKELKFEGTDFTADFHTFAVVWESEEIRWYIDGELAHTSTKNIPQGPMFMLVNLAVGGWAEEPNEDTVFPANFEVDYVRAWQRTNAK